MKCLNPILAKYSENKNLLSIANKKNKQVVIVGNFLDQCKKLNVTNEQIFNNVFRSDGYLLLPCRKCVNCLKNRSREFSIRSQIESKKIKDNFSIFLTLTYNDDYNEFGIPNVPLNDKNFMTLRKKDLQDFIKRFRESQRLFNDQKISYLACGEYGSKTLRPHYHIIFFNVIIPMLDNVLVSNNFGNAIYTNSYLVNLWKKGNISFSLANDFTNKYVVNYTLKSNKDFNFFKVMDIEKPFLLVSKKFGFDIDEFNKQLNNNLNVFKFGDSSFVAPMLSYYKYILKNYNNLDYAKYVIDNYEYNIDNMYFFDYTYKDYLNLLDLNNQKIKNRRI